MAKHMLALAVLALAGVVVLARPDEKFTTKYDNVDIDQILKNRRLLDNYVNCILDKPKARCTNDALELKKSIPDALTNECSKCSEKQKTMAEKVVRHLLENEKDIWAEFKTKYDPEGTYEKKYKERANQHGLKV